MVELNASLSDKSPIQILSSKKLFAQGQPRHRKSPSIARLDTGRLLLTFSLSEDNHPLESSVVLTESEDHGCTWSEPRVVYEERGWACLNMGGLIRLSDEDITTSLDADLS